MTTPPMFVAPAAACFSCGRPIRYQDADPDDQPWQHETAPADKHKAEPAAPEAPAQIGAPA